MNTLRNNSLFKSLAIATGILGASVFSSLPTLAENHTGSATETTPLTAPSQPVAPGTPATPGATPATPATPGATPTTPGTPQTPATPGATEAPAPPVAPGTTTQTSSIVELAANTEAFSTLAQAVEAAGLADTLGGEGPYTVFAPTDEAFAELPEGALEFLLQPENQGILRQVLAYHVVPGEVTSDALSTGPVETLGGGVAVRVAADRVIVNDGSVIQPDIQANNGVIHAVNRVLLPSQLRQALLTELNAQ